MLSIIMINENLQDRLKIASQNNDLESLQQILQQEVDINFATEEGWTALHFAAFKGHNKIVAALLEAKINIDVQGKVYGRTALHYAVDRGNLETVKLLIAKGANIRISDKANKTPLDLAQEKNFSDIVKVLSV